MHAVVLSVSLLAFCFVRCMSQAPQSCIMSAANKRPSIKVASRLRRHRANFLHVDSPCRQMNNMRGQRVPQEIVLVRVCDFCAMVCLRGVCVLFGVVLKQNMCVCVCVGVCVCACVCSHHLLCACHVMSCPIRSSA